MLPDSPSADGQRAASPREKGPGVAARPFVHPVAGRTARDRMQET